MSGSSRSALPAAPVPRAVFAPSGRRTNPSSSRASRTRRGPGRAVNFVGTITADDAVEHVHIVNAGAHGGANGFGCLPAAYDGATDGAFKMFCRAAGRLPEELAHQELVGPRRLPGVERRGDRFPGGNTFEGIAG